MFCEILMSLWSFYNLCFCWILTLAILTNKIKEVIFSICWGFLCSSIIRHGFMRWDVVKKANWFVFQWNILEMTVCPLQSELITSVIFLLSFHLADLSVYEIGYWNIPLLVSGLWFVIEALVTLFLKWSWCSIWDMNGKKWDGLILWRTWNILLYFFWIFHSFILLDIRIALPASFFCPFHWKIIYFVVHFHVCNRENFSCPFY